MRKLCVFGMLLGMLCLPWVAEATQNMTMGKQALQVQEGKTSHAPGGNTPAVGEPHKPVSVNETVASNGAGAVSTGVGQGLVPDYKAQLTAELKLAIHEQMQTALDKIEGRVNWGVAFVTALATIFLGVLGLSFWNIRMNIGKLEKESTVAKQELENICKANTQLRGEIESAKVILAELSKLRKIVTNAANSVLREAEELGKELKDKAKNVVANLNDPIDSIEDGEKSSMVYSPELFEKAQKGDAEAQYGLGMAYYTGKNVTPDFFKAFDWLLKAAEQGNKDAQFQVGWMYQQGKGVVIDNIKAAEWYECAAKQGHTKAQNNLGVLYFEGIGFPQNKVLAKKWFHAAAEQNEALAQFNLAFMLYIGDGIPEDKQQAVFWYRKAADLGYAKAQNNLGVILLAGAGASKDVEEGIRLLRKAAAKGVDRAQCHLGELYRDGCEGVLQSNSLEAEKYFRLAAEQGYAEAQEALGTMLHDGAGIPLNKEEAAQWYRKAAEQGLGVAQYNLGKMLERGDGIPVNKQEAAMWLQKAAEQNYKPE